MFCHPNQAQQNVLGVMAALGSTAEAHFTSDSPICPPVSKYIINLGEIKFDGTTFELNDPIGVSLYQEDDLWNCEYAACGILSVGNTMVEAVRSFSEDFLVLWDEIAQCSDDSLTKEAQAVKRCLLSVVKSVKTR
ncbi:MAG: hypothetical protein ABR866_13475 [Candidatus Korobacteraceae bacterium]|jgi:hypothetical protein